MVLEYLNGSKMGRFYVHKLFLASDPPLLKQLPHTFVSCPWFSSGCTKSFNAASRVGRIGC